MNGPMLQALLEDRFRLRIHRESKEVPVYEMTVAKGGPKLQRAAGERAYPTPPRFSRLGQRAKSRCRAASTSGRRKTLRASSR